MTAVERAHDVEMRTSDGVVLRAEVYRPVAGRGAWPTLLQRTVYGKDEPEYVSLAEQLAERGFLVVVQDVRGRYRSDGDYTPLWSTDPIEGRDGAEAIEWSARLSDSTGRVGTFGTSYNAVTQIQALPFKPRSLGAILAGGHAADSRSVWPGTFRVGRQLQWAIAQIGPDGRRRLQLPPPHTPTEGRRLWDLEQGKWLWWLPLSKLPGSALGGLAMHWADWLAAHSRDYLGFGPIVRAAATTPMSYYTGWYDRHVDTADLFIAASAAERTAQLRLTIGPWTHGSGRPSHVGELDFGPAAAESFVDAAVAWFRWTLIGTPPAWRDEPPVRLFVMGANVWRTFPTWPVASRPHTLFLARGGRLEPRPPTTTEFADSLSYVYDPKDPVPSTLDAQFHEGPVDQSPLAGRPDILRFETEVLSTALTVIGYPEVRLFAASDALDTDWHMKLIDVWPDGRAYNVATGMVRARWRGGWASPKLLEPGAIVEYQVRLKPTAIVFKPGHRIRLAITSSDFPNYDRNHNTGQDDMHDPTLRSAHQTILFSAAHPSSLSLPLVEN